MPDFIPGTTIPIVAPIVIDPPIKEEPKVVEKLKVVEESKVDKINKLSNEILVALKGRNESEIPLNDPYWDIRSTNHQLIWKLEEK